MAHKEALEVIRTYHNQISLLCKEKLNNRIINAENQIEKDLEILEIIKKWSFIQENYKDGYGPFTQFLCNIHTIGMEEDFNKVKEWLDND